MGGTLHRGAGVKPSLPEGIIMTARVSTVLAMPKKFQRHGKNCNKSRKSQFTIELVELYRQEPELVAATRTCQNKFLNHLEFLCRVRNKFCFF